MATLNGYIALHKGKQTEVWAETLYEAQKQAATIFRAKYSYDVTVYLCKKDGKPVVHVADF